MDSCSYEEITLGDTPTSPKWRYIPLYKKGENNKILFWQIGFDGVDHLEMDHGQEGGVITHDTTEVKLNASNKTMLEQSLLNARKRYLDKTRLGYRPLGSTDKVHMSGMKGNLYIEKGKKRQIDYPVYIQPKLDGVRLICHIDSTGSVYLRSHKNNRYTHLKHLEAPLLEFFDYLPPGCTIDGELYNHHYAHQFGSLMSIVRKVKPVHPLLPTISYHIFDIDYEDQINGPQPFEVRYKKLVDAYIKYSQDRGAAKGEEHDLPPGLIIVETQLAENESQMNDIYKHYLEEKYEGIMIKKLASGASKDSKRYKSSLYEYKKGNNILKHKPDLDEEGTIEGVKAGSGNQSDCGILIVRDPRGNEFSLSMKVPFEEKRKYLAAPDDYIGKLVTYQYQELSEAGVPRFPRGKSIRDYE